MKLPLMALLIVGSGLYALSCSTLPTEPLAPGEMRLLRIKGPAEDITANLVYLFDLFFEADGRPTVKRACFNWSGDGPYCSNVRRVNYGSPGIIEVELRPRLPDASGHGTYQLECYVEYVRDGKSIRTNAVSTHVTVLLR